MVAKLNAFQPPNNIAPQGLLVMTQPILLVGFIFTKSLGMTVFNKGHNYGIIDSREKEMRIMPQIIPIRDLKKTSELSEMCRKTKEPVFITKK